MKKEVLFSVLMFLTACSSDDLPEAPETPSEPADTAVVVEIIPEVQFMEAFAHGGWVEMEIYDEFADGSTGENLLMYIVGYSSKSFTIADNEYVRQYHISDADPSYFAVDKVAYAYDEKDGTLTFSGGKLPDSMNETFTVLSIDGDEMRCRGKVFLTPDAVSGLYVFKRMGEEALASLSTVWQNEQWRFVPVMVNTISQEQFTRLFEDSGWTETGVYDMYEDGTVGDENKFYNVAGFTSSKFYVNETGQLTEYLNYNYNPTLLETNTAKYSYDNNRIQFINAKHGDLSKVFYVLSIDENEIRLIGMPWMSSNEPGVVRSVYVFERVADDVVAQWRELWGES